MSVKKEQLSSCRVKLTFNVSGEEFDLAVDKAFEKKVKDLDVPGFRKGKLPRAMFNQKFGEESLYDEAINQIINKEYIAYLEKSKLNVVNYPEVDLDYKTLGKGKKLKFTICVEVWPEVELGQYKGIEIEKEKVEVSEQDVNESIERVLKQNAELEVVEDKPLEKGNTAVFDFEGSVDGVLFDGGKAENYSLEIGSGQFIPGFEDQMIGMNVNEEKVLKVKFPEQYQEASLAGKAADFKVVLHEIKKKVMPELTDEFVKEELEIKDVETVDQYREYIKEKILNEKNEASENKFVDELFSKVVANAKFETPEGLVNEEVERQMKQVEKQAKMYGLTVEQLLQFSGVASVDQYKELMKPGATMSVNQRIVFLAIASEEKIKISAKDYENEIKLIAEESKITAQEAEKQYSKEAITPYLQLQKVMELIKSSAIVK